LAYGEKDVIFKYIKKVKVMKEVDSIETKSGKLETLTKIREEIEEMLQDCEHIDDHNYKRRKSRRRQWVLGYKQALLNVLNVLTYEMNKL
jgi:hypothetical protein